MSDFKALLHALSVLDRAAPRKNFQREVNRDRAWREELPEDCTYETRSAEQIFEDEQCPSDGQFR